MILNGKKSNKLGTTAGAYDDWHEGNDPAGISTQDPKLMKIRSNKSWKKLSNYLKVMTLKLKHLQEHVVKTAYII